jgi:hypothetical protein
MCRAAHSFGGKILTPAMTSGGTSRLLSPPRLLNRDRTPDTTPDADADRNRKLDHERRVLVAICSAAILLALPVGIYLLGPYLAEEHRRLRPWEVPAIWAGNAAGLVWFLRFLHRHIILGEPFLDRPLRDVGPRPSALAITALTLAGVALDLCVTLHHVRAEHTGYAAAARVTGEAFRVDRWDAGEHGLQTNFHVHCRYTDSAGVTRTADFRVAQPKKMPLPRMDHAPTAAAIAAGQTPFPVPVRYDAAYPAQAWLEGAPFALDEGNDLASFSLMVLFMQSFFLSIYVPLTLWATRRAARRGVLPWYHDFYKATPLALEAGMMFVMGCAFRAGM